MKRNTEQLELSPFTASHLLFRLLFRVPVQKWNKALQEDPQSISVTTAGSVYVHSHGLSRARRCAACLGRWGNELVHDLRSMGQGAINSLRHSCNGFSRLHQWLIAWRKMTAECLFSLLEQVKVGGSSRGVHIRERRRIRSNIHAAPLWVYFGAELLFRGFHSPFSQRMGPSADCMTLLAAKSENPSQPQNQLYFAAAVLRIELSITARDL